MLLVLPFLLFSAVHALFEFPSDGCVAPAALDSCMTKTTQRAATCFSQQCPGVDPDCIKDGSCSSQNLKCLYTCLCTQAQESITCALSSCWNKASHKLMPHLAFKMRAALRKIKSNTSTAQVYSCEFQILLIGAYQGCPYAKELPFWEGGTSNLTGPGACSCGLIDIYTTILGAPQQRIACTGPGQTTVCGCCMASEIVSE
jgi:hypothetical protein